MTSAINIAAAKPKNSGNQSNEEIQKLNEIINQAPKAQATWFLNIYAQCHNDMVKSEIVFKIYQKYTEYLKSSSLFNSYHSDSAMNELHAHKILEYIGKPVTQTAFRVYVQKIDSTMILKNAIPLVILFLFYFDVELKHLMNQPIQYTGIEIEQIKNELQHAQLKLKEAIDAERNATIEVEEADDATEYSRIQQDILTETISDYRMQEKLLLQAKVLAEKALEQVERQEHQSNSKKQELKAIIIDSSIGIVKRHQAKAELQILNNDDLESLRIARLKNEAAIKKLQASARASQDARAASEDAKQRADEAMKTAILTKAKAVKAAKAAEGAIPLARAAMERLKRNMNKMMQNQSIPWGTLYLIDREVKEAEKFLPCKMIKKLKKEAEENKKRLVTPPRTRICQ